ncbi:MAG TPA: BMP family ABC transporter substrate-binding protein [Phycisphaerae bacterium]|nr:BMP family ABC transporter substrate-binding protein [Phycisphaerae bacterium]
MKISRRSLCIQLAAGVAAATTLFTTVLSPRPARAADDKPVTIGFVYVGSRSDYGYNQAQAQGAAELARMSGVKILEEENVPETVQVQKTMESMIKLDGASAIFATSYGYFDPHVIKIAGKYPDVSFFHCGGTYDPAKDPKNIYTYFGYIDECEYIAGICAGKTSKSSKLGFIAAKPIPQVLRNINAFELGAKSVNPSATTTVVFTGDWFMPTKEAEAANSLIDQGIDVLTCHVDSPKVILETAEKRGIYCCGYHANGSDLAPKGYLTGSEWHWATIFKTYLDDLRSGKQIPHTTRGGMKDGVVQMSPYGPAVSSETKTLADAAKEKAMKGELVIFKGPLKDNTGKEVIPEGKEMVQTDPVLEGMNYLVEGVVGSPGGK